LRERNVEHGTGGLVEFEAGELGVADDADDAEIGGVFGHVETEVLLDGIFIGFEETLDESFVDEGDGSGGFIVGVGEVTATDELHAEILEILGADAVPRSAALFIEFCGRMAGHKDEFAPVFGEGIVHGQAGSFDAGNMVEFVLQAAIQGNELGLGVGGGWIVHVDDDTAGNLKAKILVLDFVETTAKHGGAGDEDNGESGLNDEKSFARERGAVTIAAAGAVKRFGGIDARGEPSGDSAEEDAGEQG